MATCPTCRTHYPDDVATCASDGDALVPDDALEPELQPGTLVGEYRVEGKLGAGGFGTVYRAVHPLIGKAAAIKVLSRQFSANPQIVARFVAEARAVNQIRHRNIIDIFSFGGLEDGRQYYVMELLEGMTLDAYLRKCGGRVRPGDALPILTKVARALDAAHAAGIAHRDLKPENIFLVFDEDAGVFPKLLDFGIAKLLGDSVPGMHKTRSGMPMGTPLYMSPEQCRGKNIDHRTDIYSFGVMVHELLAGRPPFDADTAVDLLIKHTAEPPPPLSSVAPDLPAALDGPILRMLEKEPAKRPASVSEAMEALNAAARSAGIELGIAPMQFLPPSSGALATPARAAAAMAETQVADSAPTKPSQLKPTEMAVGASVVEEGKKKGSLRRSPAMIALVALVGIGAIAGALVVMRSSSADTETKLETRPAALVQAPVVPTVAPTAAPTVAPVASTPVVEALSAEVELKVETTPQGASIWRDGKQIGVAPGPIHVPRDQAVKLTFKAPGYAPLDREIPAGTEGTVKVALVKAATATKAGGGHKDLEDPWNQ
ncbi:serine/threonine-protein kinase [Polyangium aurulentum]|uniref:serine/threonine-protein kinase n=1 Tax=Polyangium aurulentum TaxID=2567896 RepID=UPI0010AE512E|nr:serine/threonine-protein kinase [Polyangium aurulentum]UQA56037.1 protein kinase [Polyangium aurulentum]